MNSSGKQIRGSRMHALAVKAARHRLAVPIVLGCTFLNSSLLPIPQDIFIIPLLSVRPRISWWLMTLCVVVSTIGGLVGYAIGYWFYDSIGRNLVTVYGYDGTLNQMRQAFVEHGWLLIVISAVTPFPYKIITISAGFLGYDALQFIWLSLIGRCVRFYAYALIFHFFGSVIERTVRRWFSVLFVVGIVFVVILAVLLGWGVFQSS